MEKQFTRGQAVWALASYFMKVDGSRAPTIFKNRIKRLLDIDRGTKNKGAFFIGAKYAFFDKKPIGSGHETLFNSFQVFYLGVGLHLLDAGFKQEEVVGFLRVARADFEREHRRLDGLKYPCADAGLYIGGTLGLNIAQREGGYDDPTVFAIIRAVQFTELWSLSKERKKSPLVFRPEFFYGFKNLANILSDQMPMNFHHCHVIEIATIAHRIDKFLSSAPLIQRGRPKAN